MLIYNVSISMLCSDDEKRCSFWHTPATPLSLGLTDIGSHASEFDRPKIWLYFRCRDSSVQSRACNWRAVAKDHCHESSAMLCPHFAGHAPAVWERMRKLHDVRNHHLQGLTALFKPLYYHSSTVSYLTFKSRDFVLITSNPTLSTTLLYSSLISIDDHNTN